MSVNTDEKLSNLPCSPGVYLMKDISGKVIYVGKARNLKKRLASYFARPEQPDMKTGVLVKKIADFEIILTGTEQEALILESDLIRQYRPRYNVILKDDKRYPSLRLDIKAPYPALQAVRKTENDGALYFGPFASPPAVRQTLNIINKTFKLRKCHADSASWEKKKRRRPCLNYHIGICLAPCCFEVGKTVYDEMVNEVILFLKGRTPDLIRKIKKEMLAASEIQAFETAAKLRDKIFALEKILEKQVSVTGDFKDRDILGMARSPARSLIILMCVRQGYLLGTRDLDFAETLSTDEEIISLFIRQHYEKDSPFVPKEIFVPVVLEDALLIEERLSKIKGEKVSILCPRRGEKARLIRMAIRNAENRLKTLIASSAAEADILIRLQQKLRTDRPAERIECFDNSNIMGSNPVAGMVVFQHAKPLKSGYRKYSVQTVAGPDDYASMEEVLRRRYGKGEKSEPYPDILMVDGGKGQLNIAVSVIRELGLEGKFDIIAIAKKDENIGETQDKIYKPGQANPVNFGTEKDLLFFLQRIRDEAHRHAVSFHRDRRSRTLTKSVLDAVPGIGKKLKQRLLGQFGSISGIRSATIEELSAVPGMNRTLAEAVKEKIFLPPS